MGNFEQKYMDLANRTLERLEEIDGNEGPHFLQAQVSYLAAKATIDVLNEIVHALGTANTKGT